MNKNFKVPTIRAHEIRDPKLGTLQAARFLGSGLFLKIYMLTRFLVEGLLRIPSNNKVPSLRARNIERAQFHEKIS